LHAYFLHAPDAREYLEKRAQGSIMAGLNMGIIKEMPVRLPPLAMQMEIVDAIDGALAMSCAIAGINQKKLVAFSELKQSLLQRAFSSELTGRDRSLHNEALARTSDPCTGCDGAISV
jgi:type I restriction enzyme S subunit